MNDFWKWVISYWQRKTVLICLPEFSYRITFYRGRIEMVKAEECEARNRQLYQVFYDEEARHGR